MSQPALSIPKRREIRNAGSQTTRRSTEQCRKMSYYSPGYKSIIIIIGRQLYSRVESLALDVEADLESEGTLP